MRLTIWTVKARRMNKLHQSRPHNPPEQEGNCYATVIACILDLDSPEDCIQVQEYYEDPRWLVTLLKWLARRGYVLYYLEAHSDVKDEIYLVTGKSPRFKDNDHICIYQNGKLVWDPSPDGKGLATEESFQIIEKF